MSLATQNSLKNDNPYGQDRPIQMNCPFCKNNIISEITQQNSWVSFIIVSIVFVVTNFIVALFAVPLFLIFTKQRVHHCSVCSNELGRDTRIFSAFDLHDDLISCKCGEFGFIVTRKVMLGITAFIILIGLIVLKIQNLKNIDLDDAPDYTDASWLEFKDQCGRDQLQDYNNLINCHKQYLDRSVYHWKGKMLKMLKSQNNQGRVFPLIVSIFKNKINFRWNIIRINDFRGSLYRYMHHAVTILVRMDPYESQYFPDILLTLDSYKVDRFQDVVMQLSRGQEIGFNATIKSLGGDMNTRHLHLRALWKLDGYIDIPSYVYEQGRYADTPKFIRAVGSPQEKQIEQQIENDQQQKEKIDNKDDSQNQKEYIQSEVDKKII